MANGASPCVICGKWVQGWTDPKTGRIICKDCYYKKYKKWPWD